MKVAWFTGVTELSRKNDWTLQKLRKILKKRSTKTVWIGESYNDREYFDEHVAGHETQVVAGKAGINIREAQVLGYELNRMC
jgi:hypothetical protein